MKQMVDQVPCPDGDHLHNPHAYCFICWNTRQVPAALAVELSLLGLLNIQFVSRAALVMWQGKVSNLRVAHGLEPTYPPRHNYKVTPLWM